MKIAKSLLFFNLVKLLDKHKISNNDLAEQLKMSPATLSQKMLGNSDWKISEMLEIQKYVNSLSEESFTLDYLFQKG